MKGRTAIRIFNRFRQLRRKPYWGNHFWIEGYCAVTGGVGRREYPGLCQVSGETGTVGGAGQAEVL